MFAFLGRFSTGHPWKVCTGWLVAGLLLTVAAPTWDAHVRDDDVRYLPERCDSVRGERLLEMSFPHEARGSRLLVVLERTEALTPEDLAFAQRLRDDLAGLSVGELEPGVQRIDERLAVVRMALPAGPASPETWLAVRRVETLARSRLAEVGGSPPRLELAGTAVAGRDLARSNLWAHIVPTSALAVLLALILLIAYRRPLLALGAALTAAAVTWVGLEMMALTTRIADVSLGEFSQPFAAVVLFGTAAVAVLLIVRRFQEELAAGENISNAAARTTLSLGTRLLIGAAVFACGWLMLGFAEYGRLRALGLDLVLGLSAVVPGCLLLTPAVVRLLGPLANWELWSADFRLPRRLPTGWAPVQEQFTRFVTARSALFGAVLLALLAPLALYGLRLRVADRPETRLWSGCTSSRGQGILERHGVAGEAAPMTLLLAAPCDWNGQQGHDFLNHFGDSLVRLPNIASVRGLATPGHAPAALWTAGLRSNNEWLPHRTGHVARLEVVFRSNPGSPESMASLETVQTWLRDRLAANSGALGSVAWECAGVTVTARDLGKVAGTDGSRAAWLMLAVLLAVLAVLVGRIETVVHLALAVVVSYPVALGAAGVMRITWGGTLGEIDWTTAALLFPILVAGGAGLSLLPSPRVNEERQRRDAEDKLRRSLTFTARRTAGCALLLAGLWAVLLLAGRGLTARLGLSAACGLLVDALLVRRVLVPALAMYLWRQQRELQGSWRQLQEVDPVRRAG